MLKKLTDAQLTGSECIARLRTESERHGTMVLRIIGGEMPRAEQPAEWIRAEVRSAVHYAALVISRTAGDPSCRYAGAPIENLGQAMS